MKPSGVNISAGFNQSAHHVGANVERRAVSQQGRQTRRVAFVDVQSRVHQCKQHVPVTIPHRVVDCATRECVMDIQRAPDGE